MKHDEDCTGHVVEAPFAEGWTCSARCGWGETYGNDAVDYADVEHDPR